MTGLQLAHVACVAVYLAIAAYVLWRAPMLQRSAGVAAISACFAWWCASLLIAHDPGATRAQAEVAYNVGVLAWASFGSLSLAFAVAFAGKRELLASRKFRAVLVLPPLIVMFEQWRGALAADYHHESWGWSYVWSTSPGSFLFYAYYGLYTTAAIAIVYVTGRRATDRHAKRQAAIIVYTAMVPFLCATATDVVLPWLDIHTVPNVAPMFLMTWTIGIAVATVRYRLFDLTPETAAGDLLAAMSDGVLLVDEAGRIVACNPAANRLLGHTSLRGIDLAAALPGELIGKLTQGEHIHERGDRIVAVSRTLVRGREGNAIGSVCLVRDITDRSRAERGYHELQRAVRALAGMHAAVDAIHKANGVREIGAGVARGLVSGLDLPGGVRIILDNEVFDSDGLVSVPAPSRYEVIASGKIRGALELHADRAPSDAEQQVLARVALEIGQTLEGLALRDAIAQSDRLASIGVLAAGVAHEINNPLTYLTLGLYEIQDGLATSSDTGAAALSQRADEAIHGAERISKIVRELGAFARDGDDVRMIPISDAINAAIAMSQHQIRHRARLVVRHNSTTAVRADLGRLTQVFLNLLVNAAQAMPDGKADAHTIEIESSDDLGGAVITVKDDGAGISADDLPHIFEPFRTTKANGEGSGLGLAISHKIARSLGGKITVQSTPGAGTTFQVYLPSAGAPAPRSSSTSIPTPRATRTTSPGRILIVDDDLPVARAVARTLGEHDVTVVGSGAEARAMIGAGATFDVILCDVMMPEENGPELHAWVAAHHPALAPRMVFVTGGAFTPETEAFLESRRADLLMKPFEPAAVLALVDDMLHRLRAS